MSDYRFDAQAEIEPGKRRGLDVVCPLRPSEARRLAAGLLAAVAQAEELMAR